MMLSLGDRNDLRKLIVHAKNNMMINPAAADLARSLEVAGDYGYTIMEEEVFFNLINRGVITCDIRTRAVDSGDAVDMDIKGVELIQFNDDREVRFVHGGSISYDGVEEIDYPRIVVESAYHIMEVSYDKIVFNRYLPEDDEDFDALCTIIDIYGLQDDVVFGHRLTTTAVKNLKKRLGIQIRVTKKPAS